MANINRITVGGVTYNITIPDGLTEAEQAQIRSNIGAISKAESDFNPDGTYPELSVGNADILTEAHAIDGVNFNGSEDITHYGVCATGAGTPEKKVSMAGFKLVTGARITVRFLTANNVSSPTLNVNSTGAIPMKSKDSTVFLVWKPEIMTLVYDGTNWCIIDGYSLVDKPVGKRLIQFSSDEPTPAAQFGGTWVVDTKYTGRALVGSGTNYPLGSTGGEATVALTREQNAPHAHTGNAYQFNATWAETAAVPTRSIVFTNEASTVYYQETTIEHVTTMRVADSGTDGKGEPHNNMSPYVVMTIWQRRG